MLLWLLAIFRAPNLVQPALEIGRDRRVLTVRERLCAAGDPRQMARNHLGRPAVSPLSGRLSRINLCYFADCAVSLATRRVGDREHTLDAGFALSTARRGCAWLRSCPRRPNG